VVENVFSLLMMSDGELPMGNGIGTRIHAFVNETSGPLLGARIAQDVRSVIRTKEPRMLVLGITTEEKITRDGTALVAAVEYQVGTENGTLAVPVGDGGGFVS
jgi:phage baseplate assembly protein W